MTDSKPTPDQVAAETIGRSIDGHLFRLQQERELVLPAAAAARLVDIDAEIAALLAEKQKIDGRRPPKSTSAVISRIP